MKAIGASSTGCCAVAARAGAARRDAATVLRLGALYRGAAADLALARRGHPGDPVVARLESLVARARQAVYADEPRRGSLRTFFARTYWVRVRERPGPLLLAIALLLGPAALAAIWALNDPGAAVGLVPGQFRGAVEPGRRHRHDERRVDRVLDGGHDEQHPGDVPRVRRRARCSASAPRSCSPTTALTLGAVAGGAIANGNGTDFAEFVTAHGIIELSCIAVAAAAGMRMGYAIVAPGPRTRMLALVEEARAAIVIVLGTVPWVILAGLIEGFVTRAGFGLVPGIVLGVGVGAVFWGLVLVRGKPARHAAAPTAAPAPSR